jgi:hypothetical protein
VRHYLVVKRRRDEGDHARLCDVRVGGAGTMGGRVRWEERKMRRCPRRRPPPPATPCAPVGGCAPRTRRSRSLRGKTEQHHRTRRVTLLFRPGLRASPHLEELGYSGARYLAAHRPRRATCTIQTKPGGERGPHVPPPPDRSATRTLPPYPPSVLINPVVCVNPETNMLAIKATTTSAVYCTGM